MRHADISYYSQHNDAIVVFYHDSRQLVLRTTTRDIEPELAECPYCHRPMRDATADTGREGRHGSSSVPQPGFVNPEYFRLLDSSSTGPPSTAAPPSPRRRLVQPAQPVSVASGSDYSAAT